MCLNHIRELFPAFNPFIEVLLWFLDHGFSIYNPKEFKF